METLKAGKEGDDRGWDRWMASPTRRTWVWANSRSWWWTGRPGVLQSMGSQSGTWLGDWTKWTDVWEDAGICAVWNYSLGMHLNRARLQSTECLQFFSPYKSPWGWGWGLCSGWWLHLYRTVVEGNIPGLHPFHIDIVIEDIFQQKLFLSVILENNW